MSSALTYLTGASDGANASTYTFAGQSFGTAASDRVIVAALVWRSGVSTREAVSCTIGGVTATLIANSSNKDGGNHSAVTIYAAIVPTGTSGDVVFTLNGTAVRCGLELFKGDGLSGVTPDITGTTGSGALSLTVNPAVATHFAAITLNGESISRRSAASGDLAAGSHTISVTNSSGGSTWTGLTERSDAELESAVSSIFSTMALVGWSVDAALPDPISGTLAATESGADTFAAAGSVAVRGTLAAQEAGADSFAGSGVVPIAGTLAAQESGVDAFDASGAVPIAGALDAQEAGQDSAAFTGSGVQASAQGSLAANESGNDFAAIVGRIAVRGQAGGVEAGQDAAMFTGRGAQATTQGALYASETGADTASVEGAVLVSGALAANDNGQDIAAFAGRIPVTGALAVQEAGDDIAQIGSGAPAVFVRPTAPVRVLPRRFIASVAERQRIASVASRRFIVQVTQP